MQQIPPQMQQMPPQIQPIQMTHQHQPPMQQMPISALQSVQQQMQGQQGQVGQGQFGSPPQQHQQQPRQTTEDGTPILFYGTSFVSVSVSLCSSFPFLVFRSLIALGNLISRSRASLAHYRSICRAMGLWETRAIR
jgi:hypothetical protein